MVLKCLLSFAILSAVAILEFSSAVRYEPNWASLDSRPLPDWYDQDKLGIFVHWGIFSVPSFDNEWFWYRSKHNHTTVIENFMHKNYRPDFTYADFAKDFTAEFFNPDDWARMFEQSGAKYVVFVSKHHEGYTNWPSKYAYSWNSVDIGPRRNLVGDLAYSVRNHTKLRFGLYHSLYEWYNPLYENDVANNYSTQEFVDFKTLPELYELVNEYEPDVVWSDGDWDDPDTYWKSTEFLAWLYNDSPVRNKVVTNDRWGKGIMCHHGGFLTCMDRYNPGVKQARKYENAMTIDKFSWGFRRNAPLSDYLGIEDLLKTFVITISTGGNMLMNVAPTKEGMIPPIYQERLLQLGQWLNVNGPAIYKTTPWTFQNDTLNSDVWYTQKIQTSGKRLVYAILLQWPQSSTITLGAPVIGSNTEVQLLGHDQPLDYSQNGHNGVVITLPKINFNAMPCQWAWSFKLSDIQN